MLDLAADRLDRRRDHVAAVGDGGRAEHDHQLGALAQHLLQRLGERVLLVRHAALGDDGRAGGREPLGGHAQGLLDHLVGEPGQDGGDDAHLADAIGRDLDQRRCRARHRHRRIAHRARHRKRNDLDGRDHLAGDHRLERRQRRKRHGFVDQVEAVDSLLVHHQHAGRFGKMVGAAGEGAVDPHALPRHRRCDVGGGFVFGHVAGFEPRHHDFGDAGRLQRGDLARADHRALLEHQRALADGMDGNAALRLGDRDGAEFHERLVSGFEPQPRSDLAHDRDRDLRRRHRADGQPDRRMDALEVGVGETLALSAARGGGRASS